MEVEFADESVCLRLQRWHSEYPQLRDNYLSAYLAAYDVSRETFLHVLNEPIEAVRDRFAVSPSWLRQVRHQRFLTTRRAVPSRSRNYRVAITRFCF